MPSSEAFDSAPTESGRKIMTENLPSESILPEPTSPGGIFLPDIRESFTEADKSINLQSFLLSHNILDNQSDGSGELWLLGQDTESQENATLSLVLKDQEQHTWLSPATIYALMLTTGCVGLMVFLINVCLLVASKFASGGRTPMLIFLRNLCVADALVGIFGVIKMTQFLPAMTWEWVNCFLPESILFTATIASNLTHVMLSTMCFSMLKDTVRFDRKQDKHRTIFSMTFLWNGSFVIGFVPHMGWNLEDHMGWNSVNRKCLFLRYVTQSYLGLVTAIISLSIVWLLVVHIGIQVLIFRNKVQEPSLLELTAPVIFATRVDVALQLTCYLPGALYIFWTCDSCAYITEQEVANDNLTALLPLMIVRATCSTALHFKRTDQMRDIIYYCFKIIKHNVLVKSGSLTTIRPVRPSVRRPSMRALNFEKENGPKVLPGSQTQSRQHAQVISNKEKVMVGGGNSPVSPLGFSVSQPTIAEETEVETTSPGEDLSPAMSSAPSWSTSDLTLASTVGSTSGGSSNGISPFTKQKTGPKQSSNQNGVKTSRRSPVELRNLSNTSMLGSYWVSEIPNRDQVVPTNPSPQLTTPQIKMNPLLGQNHDAPGSPQRRLLWAKSQLAKQFDTSSQTRTPTTKQSTIQNDNMDILSARRLDSDFGKWKLPKGNTLQSEVIVHVPAETRMT